ncbi:MAG: hypothetical protein U0231_00700 [Nitrospiraceae bacterium]
MSRPVRPPSLAGETARSGRESTQQFLDHVQQHVTSAQKAFVLERTMTPFAGKRCARAIEAWGSIARCGVRIGVYAEFWRSRGFRVTALDVDARQQGRFARRPKEQDSASATKRQAEIAFRLKPGPSMSCMPTPC